MDVLAQGLALRLRTRTAIRVRDDEEHRRYKYVSRGGPAVVDERTRKAPVGLFNP
jgi:hypothetical protein